RFLFAGRLIHWKGAHLAIRALAEVRRSLPAATLTLIGAGPEEEWLRNVAKRLDVSDAVEFAGRLSRKSLIDRLHCYTALVYPSLHDSGGLVVLEALSNGLPAICLDLGGPGATVKASCGIVVPTADASEAELVTRIAKAMASLGSMPADESIRLSRGAVDRANELSWARLTARVAGKSASA
ncbi:MAG: glycosyltransferase, partial [Terracidiphilus sp.]